MTEGLMLDPPYCDSYIYAALPFCEACPKVESIHKVIGTIAKTIGSPNRAAEDRLPSGEAVLGFFAGLLKAENEHLFEHRHPHAFHQTLMLRSRTYGIALLCHHDEHVRKATHNLFQKLYGNTEAIPPETVVAKFDSARDLLGEMIHKFVYEKEVGRHLSYMMPLVDTCRLLAEQLYILTQSQEPDIEVFQDPNDTALICQFQQEVEARLRSWPHDADTPISQEETYDQSDYASESDDAHDLLDN
jgi:ubiquitin carboxyl-terminal hydrolase 34